MTKPREKRLPEALATFAATARNKGKKPAELRPETDPKPDDLAAEEHDAADILSGNTTGDKAKTNAAIGRRVKTDKRAG